MISDFGHIELIFTVLSKLLDLTYLKVVIITILIYFSDSVAILIHENILVWGYVKEILVTGREVSLESGRT